jgi:hypothetical protein
MQALNRCIVKLFTVILLFTLSGCQTAMSTSSSNTKEKYTVVPVEWPLRFKTHSFSASCYDTIGCRVLYNNDYMVMDEKDKVSRSSASIGANYKDGWSGIYIGIENFPGPAMATWRSKDGVAHEAKIDFAEIFKDQLILHKVAREDIPEGAIISSPAIILEVNDRTIRVYMKAHIPLKEPSIPGNKYSDFKNDLILAYSHTY